MRHENRTRRNTGRIAAMGFIVAAAAMGLGTPQALGQERRPGDGRARGMRADRQERFHHRRPSGRFDRGEGVATDIDSVLKFVETHFPQQHRNLSLLRTTDQPAFERRMRQMMPRLHRMMTAFKRNPEAGKLMIDEQRLGFRIHNLADIHSDTDDPARRAGIRAEVRDLVAQRLDVEQKLRAIEIQRLERRLESIKKRLTRDLGRRDELIDRRLDDLNLLED